MADYKVIFHVDEINKWELLLKNVSNLLHGRANNTFHVEILANSEAVTYFDINRDMNADIKTMERLNKEGVKFVACNNAIMANNIEKNNIIPFVDIVPAGIIELIVKQSEGYAYIRP